MKTLIALIILIIVAFAPIGKSSLSAQEQPYIPHTPTGCPYGDSITLDSPKCVAPPSDKPVEKVKISGDGK